MIRIAQPFGFRWLDEPCRSMILAAAAWWSRHRTSRTPFTLVLLGVACRCGKKHLNIIRQLAEPLGSALCQF